MCNLIKAWAENEIDAWIQRQAPIAKRGKTIAKRGKTCNRFQAQESGDFAANKPSKTGKKVVGSKRGKKINRSQAWGSM